jgi:CRP-like cAMP-binding protein
VNVDEVLALAGGAPAVALGDGDVLIREGSTDSIVYVLESGVLEVRRNDRPIARVVERGALVGEMSVLLARPATADVVAVGRATVLRLDDVDTLLDERPGFGRFVAELLARRLQRVTSYLGDLEQQFADRSGTLGLVPTVLAELLGSDLPDPDVGSDRATDMPY